MINLFEKIGFICNKKQQETDVGYVNEYKYYPSYMVDKHYTLVTFKYKYGYLTIYRLYVHNNVDGSYYDNIFDTSDVDYIYNKLNKIFKREFRKMKLERIT